MATVNMLKVQVAEPGSGVPRSRGGRGGASGGSPTIGDLSLVALPDGTGAGAVAFRWIATRASGIGAGFRRESRWRQIRPNSEREGAEEAVSQEEKSG